MSYGWTPEQMARVNARREARGSSSLDPGTVDDSYKEKYVSESQKFQPYQAKKTKPPSVLDNYLKMLNLDKEQGSSLKEQTRPRTDLERQQSSIGKTNLKEATTQRRTLLNTPPV